MYKKQGTIRETLDAIHHQHIVLPAIQREFIWRHRQVCALFDSLMRGYPFGTFLYWTVDPSNSDKYKWYGFVTDWHEKNARHNPDSKPLPNTALTAVLDGQQRLTALHIGLQGSMAWRLPRKWWKFPENFPTRHLHLDLLSEEPEESEARYRFRFLRADRKDLPRPDSGTEYWFKVSEILTLQGKEHVREWADGKELPSNALERLDTLRKVVHEERVIFAYEEHSQETEKVLRIFTRMNRGGTRLSYSDLLLSVVVAQFGNMRDDILGFVDELNSIGPGFYFSKDFILKASLTLLDKDVRFKVENFNRPHVDRFSEQWENIKLALRRTVRLVDRFGFSGDNLGSDWALLPIAYYLYRRGSEPSESDKGIIRTWLIHSFLKRGTWSRGVDSLLNALRRAIRDNSASRFPREAIEVAMAQKDKSLEFTEEEIQDLARITIRDGRAFPLLTLLFDFVNLADNQFHIDHIFPYAKFGSSTLGEFGVPGEKHDAFRDMRDRLPNLQLLEGRKNMKKQTMLPGAWLERQHPDDATARQAQVDRHLLGDVPEGLGEFDKFYEARRKALEGKIRALLGAGQPLY